MDLCVFADQGLPALDQLIFGAMLLCFEPSGSGVYGKNSRSLDWLVLSDDPKLQRILQHNTTHVESMLFEYVWELLLYLNPVCSWNKQFLYAVFMLCVFVRLVLSLDVH